MSKALVRCGDTAPDDTYTMLDCEICGGTFPHKGRGRKPKACAWSRENVQTANRPVSNKVSVPIFSPLKTLEGLKAGDTVYRLSDMLGSDLVRRRFPHEYDVTKVVEDGIHLVRAAKAGYKHPVVAVETPTGLYVKTGTEYIDKLSDEDEGIDDDE